MKNNETITSGTNNDYLYVPSCDHDFRYSHTEYPTGTFTSVPPATDVVICRKCGMIIRTPKPY